jgi:hypothetical protein
VSYEGKLRLTFLQSSPKPHASRAEHEGSGNDEKAARHEGKEQTDNSDEHKGTAESSDGDALKWFLRLHDSDLLHSGLPLNVRDRPNNRSRFSFQSLA